jgi:hypothetical protein
MLTATSTRRTLSDVPVQKSLLLGSALWPLEFLRHPECRRVDLPLSEGVKPKFVMARITKSPGAPAPRSEPFPALLPGPRKGFVIVAWGNFPRVDLTTSTTRPSRVPCDEMTCEAGGENLRRAILRENSDPGMGEPWQSPPDPGHTWRGHAVSFVTNLE